MAHTEVLLVQPVEGLGGEGDQVKVRAGYARNYLLPRKIAVQLNASNKKHVDALKKRRAEREQTELNGAQDVAKKLEKTSLAFAVKTGEVGNCSVRSPRRTCMTSSRRPVSRSTRRRFTFSRRSRRSASTR